MLLTGTRSRQRVPGALGYGTDTYEVSRAMAALSVLPGVRAAASDTILAPDGFSCRDQIRDGSGREAGHVAELRRRSGLAAGRDAAAFKGGDSSGAEEGGCPSSAGGQPVRLPSKLGRLAEASLIPASKTVLASVRPKT